MGAPENLRVTEIERPTPGPGEVLVEVVAAGVDRGVWHLMTGRPYVMRIMGFGLRRVPAFRGSTSRGAWPPSAQACSSSRSATRSSSRVRLVRPVRDREGQARREARGHHAHGGRRAAISGITALQALTDTGHLEAGQHVLVIGASGGVGSHAVQLAKALGATVTGVASGRKAELVRDLGADHVIDHETTDYLDGRTRYDLIVDTGELPTRCATSGARSPAPAPSSSSEARAAAGGPAARDGSCAP